MKRIFYFCFLLLFFIAGKINAQCWSKISAGGYHTIGIKSDGTLWAWGGNQYGQLGDGTLINKNNPIKIGNDNDWIEVAAGQASSFAIKSDGTLWAWGNNEIGQLGDSTGVNKNYPIRVGTENNWSKISAGNLFTLAIKTDGTLWGWGRGKQYQLADSTGANDRSYPIQIGTDNNWAKISAGQVHSLAIKTNGTLWAWGTNTDGEIGDSTTNIAVTPIQIGTANNWTEISAGINYSHAIKNNGTLWGWGSNESCNLGNGLQSMCGGSILYPVQIGNFNDWLDVESYKFSGELFLFATQIIGSSLALKTNGTLWAWGNNYDGQLGDGTIINRSTPVQVGTSSNWTNAYVGISSSISMTNDGVLYAWGKNDYGKLAINVTNAVLPTIAAFPVTTSITGSTVVCAGSSIKAYYQVPCAIANGIVITVQLSDAGGNFAFPVTIGTSNTTSTSDSIICTIPLNTLNGNGYRIRVVTSNPFVIGADNGSNITINGAVPQIAFAASPQAGAAPLLTAINNTTPNRTNYTWLWTFGDGTTSTSNGATVFHSYTFPGLYDVSVVATSTATGCSDTLYQQGYIFVVGNTCTHTASVTPSGTVTLCTGNSLSANSGTNYSYQWNINGVAIPGAISINYQPTQSGYYSVTVMNNGCPVTSDSTLVTLVPGPPPPVITASGSIQSCAGGTVTLTASGGTGSYVWNTGATTNSISVTGSGTFYVSISNSVTGCVSNSLPYTVNASSVPAPEICVVTVDSISKFNIISWDKTPYSTQDTFVVYRDISNNNYQQIGKVPYDSLSQFVDTVASLFAANGDPNVSSWRYKLSVIDSCGIESALGPFHQTIFLQNNGGNFSWNHYQIEGQTSPVFALQNYMIYRDDVSSGNWQPIQSLSASSTAYTDPNFSIYQNYASYRIETVWGISCDPTRSLINTSRSNVKNLVNPLFVDAHKPSDYSLNVFPNPVKENFTIELSVKETTTAIIKLLDVQGREVRQTQRTLNTGKNLETITVADLSFGIYFVQLQVGEQVLRKKMVKE